VIGTKTIFRGNVINSLDEIKKLSALPSLTSLTLLENPIRETPDYRLKVIAQLPNLKRLDKDAVTEEELQKAKSLLNGPTAVPDGGSGEAVQQESA
jgi:Leucine-rich repeat (LRR) protein